MVILSNRGIQNILQKEKIFSVFSFSLSFLMSLAKTIKPGNLAKK